MLVLTRKPQEDIFIGENIRIMIIDVSGKQVRLGIEAPEEISVFRGEVIKRIAEENRRAALSAGTVENSIATPRKFFMKKDFINGE